MRAILYSRLRKTDGRSCPEGVAHMPDSRDGDITRRGFLVKAGQGLPATQALGPLATGASAQQAPDPPGRKAGWATAAFASLPTTQILPPFAKAEKPRGAARARAHP